MEDTHQPDAEDKEREFGFVSLPRISALSRPTTASGVGTAADGLLRDV